MLFVMHSKVLLKRKSNTIRYVLHKDNLQHFKKIGLKEMIVKSRTEVKFFLNNSIKSYKISLLGFYLSDSGHLYVVHLYSYIYIYTYMYKIINIIVIIILTDFCGDGVGIVRIISEFDKEASQ